MTEYLAMGGYGAYVWTSFGLAALVLAWNAIAARRLHESARKKALLARSEGRRA